MFICENCKAIIPSKTPCSLIVIERREKEYINKFYKKDERTRKFKLHISNTKGWEIVKEIKVCPSCEFMFQGKGENKNVIK